MKQQMLQKAKSFIKRGRSAVMALGLFASMALPLTTVATANAAPLAASPKISFTFDDGLASALTNAAPALATYHIPATDYVITGCVGMTTTPNTCAADNDVSYLTWDQVTQLQNTYGWEIGSHTVTHPLLASTDPTVQPTALTQAQVVNELTASKAALNAHGFPALSFAAPYGDYNNFTRAEAAKLYTTFRGFADVGYNAFPYNDQLVYVQQVRAGVTVAQVKAYVDQAKAQNAWLVLVFHEVRPAATTSTNPDDYQYSIEDLTQIAQYVSQQNIPVTKMSDSPVQGTNLIPGGGTFDNGAALGTYSAATGPSATAWTTDDPANVTLNADNNGSYPGPMNSVSLKSGTANNHLFSPLVPVTAGTQYVLKTYLNVQSISSGEVGFYVHEYDANGVELPGQWKKAEPTAFVDNMNFTYTPSAGATKAALEIYTLANGNVQAYVDNVMWLGDSTVTPTGKAGDVNGDNKVDAIDLSILSSHWLTTGATLAQGDLNDDGTVNAIDLSILSTNWGK